MKKIILILAVMLSGCSTQWYQYELNAAAKACEGSDKILYIRSSAAYKSVMCTNGTFYKLNYQ